MLLSYAVWFGSRMTEASGTPLYFTISPYIKNSNLERERREWHAKEYGNASDHLIFLGVE